MQIPQSWSVGGACYQPAFMGSCLFVKHVRPFDLVDRYGKISGHGEVIKNVLCSDWKEEYAQSQSWTVVVALKNL